MHLPGMEPPSRPTRQNRAANATGSPFAVEVTRSKNRRKTVGAHLVGNTLRLAIPAWMSRTEEAHWVEVMSGRFARARSTDRIDLTKRAAMLAKRYDLPKPTDIRWAKGMQTQWGSCTPSTGEIRVSDRLAAYPDWVINYLIVHELAHILEPGHNDAFWDLVHRYPSSERAIGFLIAKSGDDED
jgi:predicted metal-dependent hydrolase